MIRERCIGKVNLEPTKMTTDGAICPDFDRRFGGGRVFFTLYRYAKESRCVTISMVYVYSFEDPMVFSSNVISARYDLLCTPYDDGLEGLSDASTPSSENTLWKYPKD